MRLIDADALINTLNEEKIKFNADINYIILNAPTIDAEPIKIGHWLPYEFGDYHWHKCSVCEKADKYIETIDNRGDLQAIRNFCPLCGAKMDEVEE